MSTPDILIKHVKSFEVLNKIYLTHCSAKKDISLKNSRKKVKPVKLYTAKPTQRFMNRCINAHVPWAIFSDKYGIWLSKEKHEWYEKNPDKVTDKEFKSLLEDFDNSLSGYDEIFFYYNPGRFHPLYEKLLFKTKLKNRIQKITHISDID